MKVCSKCGERKPLADFHRSATGKFGVRSVCKKCANARGREYSAAYRKENPEKIKKSNKEQYRKNKIADRKRNTLWYANHPEKKRETRRKQYLRHPHVYKAAARARDAARIHATPAWGNKRLIEFKYDLAARMTKATGCQWDVDHIVPLRHPLVCGLHVENNLQVITHAKNMSKGNRWTQ